MFHLHNTTILTNNWYNCKKNFQFCMGVKKMGWQFQSVPCMARFRLDVPRNGCIKPHSTGLKHRRLRTAIHWKHIWNLPANLHFEMGSNTIKLIFYYCRLPVSSKLQCPRWKALFHGRGNTAPPVLESGFCRFYVPLRGLF